MPCHFFFFKIHVNINFMLTVILIKKIKKKKSILSLPLQIGAPNQFNTVAESIFIDLTLE
jgi:predicted transporter